MKQLLLMRHGEAGWKQPGQTDHDRSLSPQGERDVQNMAQLLIQKEVKIDAILVSTAHRTRKTAQIMAPNGNSACEIHASRQLYLAPAETILDHIAEHHISSETLLLIGHNPGLESLLADFTDHFHAFSAGSIAQLELAIDSWDELNGRTQSQLINFWHPN